LNEVLLEKLEWLVEQLTETRGQRIVKRGLAKALLTGIEEDVEEDVRTSKKIDRFVHKDDRSLHRLVLN
jgi:hypothetical protein